MNGFIYYNAISTVGNGVRKISKILLYEQIYEFYKEQIITKVLLPGDKLPTEMEIAKQFNVSRITVIRALKDLELEGFIDRIQGSGSYIKENQDRPQTHSNSPSIISLILPTDEDFKPNFLRGIEEVAKQHNYFVTFHQITEDPESEKKVLLELLVHGSKGVILYPTDTPRNMELYSKLLIQKFPLILIDRKIPGLDLPIIWTDNESGFYDITKHLIELGHSKLIFVGTHVFSLSSELERYKGFCKAHIDNGLPLLEKHVYSQDSIKEMPPDYKESMEDNLRAVNFLMDSLQNIPSSERPTAIAAVNDSVAQLIISVALQRKISIPGEYSLTGFDDRVFAAHLPVPLTTLTQPVYEIGRQAALELFALIKNPDTEPCNKQIKGKLCIRKSTAPPGVDLS